MFGNSSGAAEYMIVGLGNPGKKYEYTRHNTGFMAVDYMLGKLPVKKQTKKFEGELYFCDINGLSTVILKPQTFMNLSGEAVTAAASFYKIPTENIVVISDDISLPVGKLRVRKSGSCGGHNGLRDIINRLGTDAVKRIKIGIGERENPNYDLADWVLSRFKSDEIATLNEKFPSVLAAAELLLRGKCDEAMNKYNG